MQTKTSVLIKFFLGGGEIPPYRPRINTGSNPWSYCLIITPCSHLILPAWALRSALLDRQVWCGRLTASYFKSCSSLMLHISIRLLSYVVTIAFFCFTIYVQFTSFLIPVIDVRLSCLFINKRICQIVTVAEISVTVTGQIERKIERITADLISDKTFVDTCDVLERIVAAKLGLFRKSAACEINNFCSHCSVTLCDCTRP